MKRKVIQLAGKTLVVSLPSKWARNYGVKKGAEIDVEERRASLFISLGDDTSNIDKSVAVDISGLGSMTKRVLGALFKVGYDEIDISFQSVKELEDIQQVLKDEFVGFDVVERSRSSIKLKNVASINYDDFDRILRRTFMLIEQMSSESLEAIKTKDAKWASNIAFMDRDVNRYCDFCRRVLNMKGYLVTQRVAPYYCIVEQLERIGDGYRDVCRLFARKPFELSANLKGLYDDINDYFKIIHKLHYDFDLKKMSSFGDMSGKLSDRFEKAIKAAKKEEVFVVSKLNSIRENLFDMNGVILASNL